MTSIKKRSVSFTAPRSPIYTEVFLGSTRNQWSRVTGDRGSAQSEPEPAVESKRKCPPSPVTWRMPLSELRRLAQATGGTAGPPDDRGEGAALQGSAARLSPTTDRRPAGLRHDGIMHGSSRDQSRYPNHGAWSAGTAGRARSPEPCGDRALPRLPEEGLEPSPGCPDGILNPARLPIPPLRRRVCPEASVIEPITCPASAPRRRPTCSSKRYLSRRRSRRNRPARVTKTPAARIASLRAPPTPGLAEHRPVPRHRRIDSRTREMHPHSVSVIGEWR